MISLDNILLTSIAQASISISLAMFVRFVLNLQRSGELALGEPGLH